MYKDVEGQEPIILEQLDIRQFISFDYCGSEGRDNRPFIAYISTS